MIVYTVSETTNTQNTLHVDTINVFYQFFLHSNSVRQEEIQLCLKYNVNNEFINNIYLLNERIYTDKELGISSDKIIQIDIKKRIMFKDVFEYIYINNITGYNVIINSDIFFDKTIQHLFKSDIHINKKMYALLRYEYEPDDYNKSLLFGARGDSQDTWIIHSNFTFGKKECKVFNFEFGKPGCDNKMTYLMSTLGFEILNDPEFIKTYHIHTSNIRSYSNLDKISKPYEIVMPNIFLREINKDKFLNIEYYHKNYGIQFNTKYNHKKSNVKLYEYIKNKMLNEEHFIIPRVAGIETDFALFYMITSTPDYKDKFNLLKYLEDNKYKIKNNAGIKLSSMESIQHYSLLFLEAFSLCDIYASWAPFDCVYQSYPTSHTVLNNMFQEKDTIYSEVFDIYHYIYSTPWTFALKNKRVLMVSPFEESIKTKIDNRKDIYGIDLFPGCEIITIKPPQTQGDEESAEFDIELINFFKRLDEIKDKYDVALVSCGGYGNLVCSYIYKCGKSAIYVGGVLQMYWGILGTRWFENRPDIIRLFLNKSWNRPTNNEKPKNHNNIENSCYW